MPGFLVPESCVLGPFALGFLVPESFALEPIVLEPFGRGFLVLGLFVPRLLVLRFLAPGSAVLGPLASGFLMRGSLMPDAEGQTGGQAEQREGGYDVAMVEGRDEGRQDQQHGPRGPRQQYGAAEPP
jgi:hypothetical protein